MLFGKMKIIFLTILLISSEGFAQAGGSCFNCHGRGSKNSLKRRATLIVDYGRFKRSVHGELDCEDCHDQVNPDKIPHFKGKKYPRVNCGNCHDDIVQNYKSNFHFRFVKNKKNRKPPSCEDCHGRHYIKSPKEVRNKTKAYCNKCHNNILVDFKNGFHNNIEVQNCVCGTCHDISQISDSLKYSVHANLICSDCHKFEAGNVEKHQEGVNYVQLAKCSTCHKKEYEQHKKSIHGISLTEGIEDAAKCWDCHGGHNILKVSNKKSPVYFKNIPETCIRCHGNKEFQKKHKAIVANASIKFYKNSVHGRLLAKGNFKAANCISCHGVHNIKNIVQPNSTISPFNLPNTCGKCHEKEAQEYKESIHWIYVERGVKLAPVCNDCHSEHSIENIKGKANRVKARKMEKSTCVSCHSNKILTERFGLSGKQPYAYEDSYHGMAAARGDKRVALCTDCHGVHKILPKNNPASSVNIKNVKNTCSRCHKDATQVFAESYSHKPITHQGSYLENLITRIYIWLILIVIGGMIIHNLIIFIFELRQKSKEEKAKPAAPRFLRNEIFQHLLLLISFIVLAMTGFALKFPHSWYSIGLNNLGLTEPVRRIVHRISAVILIIDAVYHVVYLFSSERGKSILKGILPRVKDFKDLWNNLKYYLRLRKYPPLFEKFDYAEKAEYWALVWGVVVMGVTGLILWFPTLVGNWAPPWLIHICELIHFYEAVLATLAIIVWHWFFVIFHPKQYPMSLTWLSGEVTLEEYSENHKEHIYEIILEWVKFKKGFIKKEDLSFDANILIDYLKRKNFEPDKIFEELMNKDENLKRRINAEINSLEKGEG